MAEEWRDVVGFEGKYQISSLGRVRSLDRYVNSKNGSKALRRGKLISPHTAAKTGYLSFTLRKPGVKKTESVHRLVCEAFHGPAPFKGAQVAHNDGSRTNNAASNLRWTDAKGNAEDRNGHGTAPIGEGAGNHKVKEPEVLAIRAEYTGEFGQLTKLAAQYGITKQQVANIVKRRQWTHI